MDLEVAFLEARVPLTKTFGKDSNGQLSKSSYPHAKRVTSTVETISGLDKLAEAIQEHGDEGHCLLKGKLNRDLNDESRAGATNRTDTTNWMCLDLDGLKSIDSPTIFMTLLGLQDISYVLQYSSSMGVDPDKGLSCHIFIQLEEGVMPSQLRSWLMHQNLSLPKLRKELKLASDHMSLRYGLDVSTCDNGKILYIAPPECHDGVEDALKGQRVQYIQMKQEVLPLSRLGLTKLNPDDLAAERDRQLNILRKDAGLEPREYTSKHFRGEPVLANPDIAEITGYKEERGFAYFNINGGDSWAYYHPLNNPHIVYCFKGDQKFATKDFLPNYLEEQGLSRAKEFKQEEKDRAKEQAREEYEHSLKMAAKRKTGRTWLAFLDVPTDTYYRGFFDHDTCDLQVNKTNSLIKVMHFLKDNGQQEMDYVPEWHLRFDYMCDARFDPEQRLINTYQPSKLIIQEQPPKTSRKTRKVPPTVEKVIKHVVANDEKAYDDFLNWFACIVQKKAFPRSAWVFFGVQGTGKGTLFHKVLAPIIGENYCQSKLFKDMEENFNGWLERTVLCMLDEVSVGDARHKERLMATLKNNITEPRVSVRAMRTDSRMVLNNCNYILCSNKPDPVVVEDTDRRFHIAPYQTEKLKLTDNEIDVKLPAELQDFVFFLRAYEVDEKRARVPGDNVTKEHLKHISRSAIDSVSLALSQGDIEFFMDQLPKDIHALEISPDDNTAAQAKAYREFMELLINGKVGTDGEVRLHRDDLRQVLNYLVGSMPDSPNKFTAYLKHHGIYPTKMRLGGKIAQGISLVPRRKEHHAAEWNTYVNAAPDITGKNVTKIPPKKSARA